MLKKIGQITAVYLFSTFVLLNIIGIFSIWSMDVHRISLLSRNYIKRIFSVKQRGMCCRFILSCFLLFSSLTLSWYHPFEDPSGQACDLSISNNLPLQETPVGDFRVGTTCTSYKRYGGGCTGCECLYASASLPEYLDQPVSIDWGKQPYVILECDGVVPAVGKEIRGDKSGATCLRLDVPLQDGEVSFYAVRNVEHFYFAVYDPNIFIVSNFRVTLKQDNFDCETLKQVLDSKVVFYHVKYQTVAGSWYCDEYCICPHGAWSGSFTGGGTQDDVNPSKAKLTITPISTIGINSNMNTSCLCPDDPQCPSSGSGCDGNSCDPSGPGILSIYNASASVGNQQHQTLASNASIASSADGTPEVNRKGAWRRVERTWKHSGIQYDFQRDLSDNIIQVKVSFIVTDPDGLSHYYDYVQSGLWDSEEAAKEDTKNNSEGKILLRSTARDGVTLLEFDYDSYDRLVMQKSISPTGNVDGMIIYSYSDENPNELKRLWAGIDENDYSAYPAIPSGGRWIDLSHDPETGRLYSIDSNCHSCQGGVKQYEYGGPSGDQVTAIKQVVLNEQSQPVERYLKRYTYDSRGRMKSYSLGDFELLVNQWERTDFDPADPDGTTGGNILIRRDFVTNTEYRAKVYLADDNGGLTSEIHYHDVQTYDPYAMDQWLVGPYSVYSYSREGSVYVTTYPKGNKLRTYYDAKGNVIKRQWEGALHPHVQYEYQDYWQNGNTVSKLKKEINAYGGQTVYDYTWDGLNLIRRTDPLPQFGVSDNESQVTEYEYEQGRLVLERTKDSLGQWISTKYEYDDYGNMVKRIEGYGSSNPLETIYQYNEFNENVKVIEPGNKIRRNFYSASGTLTATAVYSDDQNNLAVSATVYVYENGMLKATKEAKMDEPFVFVGTEDGITWVSETYDYDDYGRRIAVIKDADGEHLVTRYEYNNQNEIVLVLKPDQRYQRTVRDGRGLVSREITGVKVGEEYQDKAITSYYYDLNGNLTRKVDPEGVTEIYQYDYRDRMIRSRRSR